MMKIKKVKKIKKNNLRLSGSKFNYIQKSARETKKESLH